MRLWSKFAIGLFGVCCCLRASEIEESFALQEHHVLYKIFANQEYCVSAFSGDKIFVRPQNICIVDQNILLQINEVEMIPIPILQRDSRGFFLQTDSIVNSMAPNRDRLWQCPYCNHWWPMGQKCQNAECPTNQW